MLCCQLCPFFLLTSCFPRVLEILVMDMCSFVLWIGRFETSQTWNQWPYKHSGLPKLGLTIGSQTNYGTRESSSFPMGKLDAQFGVKIDASAQTIGGLQL